MRAITEKAVSEKLRILEFFVRAFALLGDAKSCFALKYEALLLRQVESSSCQSLQVSYMEWLNFAGNLIDNGCYPVARQACENALLCLQKDGVANSKTSEFPVDKRIKSLREYAVKFAAPSSVQAQATEYLKRKTVENSNRNSPFNKETKCTGSILFRNGIKKRNARQLCESQRVQQGIYRSVAN
ncbi:hypothetical protein JCGZ_17351 [Jatropha curcas]|uniref:Uncharacterized protein n=2 Tax=Jatropha curcas TaxID=180498 RepID=A0A067LMV9_JATCU|nr:hypothetical protein JCGZ_17351 [Jatropha curcas]